MATSQAGYRASVIGATGAVGSAIVKELIQSPRCSGVVAIVRRPMEITDAKLTQHVMAFDDLREKAPSALQGCSVAFCCVGTSQPSKVTKEALWKVDVGYAEAFGEACKAAGVRYMSLLGAVGADATSSIHMIKVKGAAEDALTKLGFERTALFRPSWLITEKARYGLTDHAARAVLPLVSVLLPSKWHGVKVEDLGRAMVIDAETPGKTGTEVFHYADFKRLLAQGFAK